MKPAPFLFGLTATLFSGVVYAAPSQVLSAEVLLFGVAGMLVTAFWLWVNSVAKKQADTEKMVAKLQEALLSRYYHKDEISEMMREVRDALKELRSEFRENQKEWKEKFAHFEQIYGR